MKYYDKQSLKIKKIKNRALQQAPYSGSYPAVEYNQAEAEARSLIIDAHAGRQQRSEYAVGAGEICKKKFW